MSQGKWMDELRKLEQADKPRQEIDVASATGPAYLDLQGQPLREVVAAVDRVRILSSNIEVGYVSLRAASQGISLHLDKIVVYGHQRKRGFAKQALHELTSAAASAGFTEIVGEAAPDDRSKVEELVRLYEGCGYQIDRTRSPNPGIRKALS